MSQPAPTLSQIRAQVDAIRKKRSGAQTIGIRAAGRWTGDPRVEVGDEQYAIFQCDSPLAMREALLQPADHCTRVLISNVDDAQISDDILLRLTPRRFVPLDGWQIVQSLFQARAIDPRLTRYSWIADMLVDLNPPGGFPPVPSGFLDAETVWRILLQHRIGLDTRGIDLAALLRWSADAEAVAGFRSSSEEFRAAAREWLVEQTGPAAAAILDCVASQPSPDTLPIGLVLGVIFNPRASQKLQKSLGKLEVKYLGGESPAAPIRERWQAAATEAVRMESLPLPKRKHLLARADEILYELEADRFAWISDTSPIGFDQRLQHFGRTLSDVVASSAVTSTESLDQVRESILEHDAARRESRRLQRLEMAMRLVRWLIRSQSSTKPQSLADAARHYLREGGFLDWARQTLRNGDPVQELSQAYAQLCERVTRYREQDSEQFARLLVDWTASKTSDAFVMPVERILDQIVAPLAARTRVLVVVLDGMSVAVFRELMADLLGRDWALLVEEGVGLRPGLATVPSLTEVSRCSLLSGRRSQGNGTQEQSAFTQHPALLKHCRADSPPVLFHKKSLLESDDGGLSGEIREAIASQHRRIVGVVVNAVDDHLLKGDQIDTPWTRDTIVALPTLLQGARTARRTVVLLSDHGHIIENHTRFRQYEGGGDRWRPDEGEPEPGELRIKGPRVVMPDSQTLIAPWTEKLRYKGKKNGYHGGVSPQEMIVPIAVLTAGDTPPDGWTEAPVDLPVWWNADAPASETEQVVTPPPPPKPKPGRLFDPDVEPMTSTSALEPASAVPHWISALLNSPVYASQKELGGRKPVDDQQLTRLLTSLDRRGGKLTSPALARELGCSLMRLRGLLAKVTQVLNIDGYQVISRDDASDTIALDRPLLLKQFDLGESS
ncbi:PglZ domain protein [Maioricimonas rarisocia]|uniref:PglZ domain protein n=1 Tax=Maioricimonas rarisocia TaxID=2528026 RepID=A0A517ZFK6_9PLAN|nr:BREX-2 system phosphatase PglZ [Maioricimonas rarisocia]QDU41270.1 PglZ domain protein [Maioricimonas rarisocia]